MSFPSVSSMPPNSSDPIALATYYQYHPVPQAYNAGVVVASIVASMLGAETTLLLLSRRTATAGLRNWALLLLAATSMGSVGIWGMHFIGMNITLKPTPDITWYIQFNPGFTVLSLFVPMLSLALAFVFVGAGPESLPVDENEDSPGLKREKPVSIWRGRAAHLINLRIVIGGLLVGGTVALMHYSAGFSASFDRQYSVYHLPFSIILACVASTLSLLVFFRFQTQWQDNWWKKLICACGLAIGVCGMHYLGLTGTQWYVPMGKTQGFTAGKKTSTVLTIAISVMCFAVCVISTIIVLSDFIVTRESRRKARRVVIVSATFDKAGRLLVDLNGMLPMAEVETDFPLKEIVEELNYRQPTFQWLYTLSWDWSILDPLLPQILSRALGHGSGSSAAASAFPGTPKLFRGRKEPGTSYASSKNTAQLALFKDRCIETTQILAQQLSLPISQMGVFFDNILRTGTRTAAGTAEHANSKKIKGDEESSMFSVSVAQPRKQGVMLFLVRELSNQHADTSESYLKRGYRFADTRWFAPVFADRAAVEKAEIDGLFDQLKLYAKRGTKPCVRSGGVYVGFFAVRPSISRQGGIDTLVYQFARHQIPAYRLPDVEKITDETRAWVGTMAGRCMRDLGEMCSKEVDTTMPPPSSKLAEELWIFKSSLVLAMDAMSANLTMFPELENRALLSAEIVDLPSSPDDSTTPASMIVFQATFSSPSRHGDELPGLSIQPEGLGSYKKQDPPPTFVFVPYTLFSKSQMMMLRGSGARKFARESRAELIKRYPAHPQASRRPTFPEPQNTTPFQSPQNFDIDEKSGEKSLGLPQQDPVHNEQNRTSGLMADYRISDPAVQLEDTNNPLARSITDPSHPQNGARSVTFASPRDPLSKVPAEVVHQDNGSYFDSVAAPAYSPTRPHTAPGLASKLCSSKRSLTDRQSNRSSDTNNITQYDVQDVYTPAPFQTITAEPTLPASPEIISTVQPLAVTARLRSDDWPARCLDGLEQSAAGDELLGVQW